ncbi:MAG: hypothetical protein ACK40O_11325 [Allosphingosinicella sp.]
MFHPDPRQFADPALKAVEDGILPAVGTMLDTLIESAGLARPGTDADAYAGELRALAGEAARLAEELETLRRQAEGRRIPA